MQNVSKSVTQHMIAWKTSSGYAHSVVKINQTDINHSSATKDFLSYVDDIVRTVRGDTKELLDAVNNLHPNLQFTLETSDDKTACHFWICQLTYNRRGTCFAHGIKIHQILEQF